MNVHIHMPHYIPKTILYLLVDVILHPRLGRTFSPQTVPSRVGQEVASTGSKQSSCKWKGSGHVSGNEIWVFFLSFCCFCNIFIFHQFCGFFLSFRAFLGHLRNLPGFKPQMPNVDSEGSLAKSLGLQRYDVQHFADVSWKLQVQRIAASRGASTQLHPGLELNHPTNICVHKARSIMLAMHLKPGIILWIPLRLLYFTNLHHKSQGYLLSFVFFQK